MNLFASFIFFGWIPIILCIFLVLPPRRAVIFSAVLGWLFVPTVIFSLPGIPDYTKVTATVMGIILATFIFDAGRIIAFRPRWYDLPMLYWCVVPFFSAIANDLGAYDGMSIALDWIVSWGFPYLIGRLYFNDLDGLRELSIGIVIGALIYSPLCLYEIRMSPQLQRMFYGFGNFEPPRFGGYRPRVFMLSGLELGMYMTAASLVGYWMWAKGEWKRLRGYSFGWILAALMVTTVLCKSTGALIELVIGLAVLYAATSGKGRSWPVWILLAIAPLYMITRTLNLWSGEQAVELATMFIGADRAESLEFRFINEDTLIDWALKRPNFGWSGWGRNLVFCQKTGRMAVTDGLWIVALGMTGLYGLIAFTATFLLPVVLLTKRYPVRLWREPDVAPAAALGVLLVLAMIDNLSNGMLNPIYTIAAGGLAGLTPGLRSLSKKGFGADKARSKVSRKRVDLVAEGHARRAERLAVSGQIAEAEQAHRLVLEHRTAAAAEDPGGNRDLAIAYERFGRFLGQIGRQDEAEDAWKSAIHLRQTLTKEFPDVLAYRSEWAEAQNDLAWVLANGPDPAARDPQQAVLLATQATEIDPERGTFWNTLGTALYRDGDWDASIAALEKSAKSGPNAYDLLFLAMAHARRGDDRRARDYLVRATTQVAREAPNHAGLAHLRAEAVATIDAG